jgi:hypothetical protein
VLFEALGRLRPDGEQPMARDSLFRIYSMTKPIVSLAALMLMEQGRLQLAHPVSRYLPSFAKQTVWTPEGPRPVQREASLHDLLRHTAGLSYAWDETPVAQAPRRAHRLAPARQRAAGPGPGAPAPAARSRHGLGVQPRHRCAGRRAGGDRGPIPGGLAAAPDPAPAGHGRHRLAVPAAQRQRLASLLPKTRSRVRQ